MLVYLKDVNSDAAGRPVILFLTSRGSEPGPANGSRQWQTMRWTGTEWVRRPFTTSGNNYDHGSLYIEPDGTWREPSASCLYFTNQRGEVRRLPQRMDGSSAQPELVK